MIYDVDYSSVLKCCNIFTYEKLFLLVSALYIKRQIVGYRNVILVHG